MLNLPQELASGARIGLDQLLEHLQVDRQSDQVLLRAVMQIPLDVPSLGVLGGDDALPRGAQLFSESNVAESGSGPRCQIVEQRSLGWRKRLARLLADRDLAHGLALVNHRGGALEV